VRECTGYVCMCTCACVRACVALSQALSECMQEAKLTVLDAGHDLEACMRFDLTRTVIQIKSVLVVKRESERVCCVDFTPIDEGA
jgi:hypothetical protein